MGFAKLEKEIKKVNQALHQSISWLKNSGIQNNYKKNSSLAGSVNAWYDPSKRKYSFVYSEINGYFMTMMVFLYRRTGDWSYLEQGLKAAKWLISNAQEKNGGFRCLFLIDKNSNHAHKKNQIYSFDNGIIISGLTSLYKETKKKFLIKSAERCANWIIKFCIDKNGLVKPVYEIEENKFFESDKEWSTTSGSYHSKISIGLANLYSVTKKKIYIDASKKICNSSLKFQEKNGRFVSFPYRGGTNAHPHCYSAEGLWVLGTYLKNKKYLSSSEKATKWILSKQNKKGKIPRLFLINSSIYHERIDAIAQTIRLVFLMQFNKEKKNLKPYEYKLSQLLKILLKYQYQANTKQKVRGSFSWGKKSDGKLVSHANSWVTFFSIQALYFYKDFLESKKVKFDEFTFV
jgi:rhamnogalacturonyl hydrolase YesR